MDRGHGRQAVKLTTDPRLRVLIHRQLAHGLVEITGWEAVAKRRYGSDGKGLLYSQ